MTAAVDAEACAVVATAADIICSLRAADLAGWTPPRRDPSPADDPSSARERLACWPPVARGKRSRRGSSPSASAGSGSAGAQKKKKKRVRPSSRGSPASPLDYSAGSGASTSGGDDDGAFCSPPPPVVVSSTGGGVLHVEPASKVVVAGRRSVLPVPSPRPAGQRPRKKMRLPEIQQMVRSLSVENDALRQETKALLKACTVLSKENGQLETRLEQSGKRDGILISEEKKGKLQSGQRVVAEQEGHHGFALPDLNLPAHDTAD